MSVRNETAIVGQPTSGGEARVQTDSAGNLKIVGTQEHGDADSQMPVKIGGQARTTNPTAVDDGDRVNLISDDVGRQVMAPYQVRDLVNTAYVSLTGGTKTSLIAGVTSVFLDLIQISMSNNSGAATTLTLTDESTTIQSFVLPANDTRQFDFPVPIRQSATGVAWYVDLPDISGTTVTVQAQFIRNV